MHPFDGLVSCRSITVVGWWRMWAAEEIECVLSARGSAALGPGPLVGASEARRESEGKQATTTEEKLRRRLRPNCPQHKGSHCCL